MQLPFNYASRFYEMLDKPSVDSFVNILAKKENYQPLYSVSLWLSSPLDSQNYLQEIFSESVSHFAQNNTELLKAYLESKISLHKVAQDFINFIFEKRLLLDKNKSLNCLEYGDKITDNILFNVVQKKWQYKNNINILGFGCGTGVYEKKFAQFIKQHYEKVNINLYGFDPYTNQMESTIKLLNINDLQTHNELKFDFIIARWALHHVKIKDRWNNFIRCANISTKGSLILLLEEGDFDQNKHVFKQAAYRFFLVCVDIIVNAALRPQWFLSKKSQIGKHFFVDYLSDVDLNDFENEFKFKFKKEAVPITDGKTFSQSLISYQVLD